MKLVLLLLLTATAFAADSLQDQIVSKEREELEALRAAEYRTFAGLIADDAIFLNSHGPATKAEVVQHVSDFKLLDFAMDDIRFVPLSSTSGVVIYKLTQKGSAGGHEFTTTVHASAIWVKRNGKWVSVFSQETPARKETAKYY
jgi:hypothetical protein